MGRWYAATLRRWHGPDRWISVLNHILHFASLWARRFAWIYGRGQKNMKRGGIGLWSLAPRYGLAGLSRY